MLNFDKLIYNSKAYNIVSLDAKIGRLSHAYLFVSQDENFLFKFCENICKLLINLNEKQFVEKNNLRVEKHIHPDVKFFGTDKNIDVNTISQIVEDSNYSPFESDKKIFVLWNVHLMNEASQNKILKTLEEPPKNTYFIFAAKSASKLLPTVISRVKQVELDSILADEIAELLVESGVPRNVAEICAASSGENASYAEKLAVDETFIEFYNQIVSAFFEINGSKDILKFSKGFSAKTVDKREFLNIFITISRDIAFIIAGSEQLVINKNSLSKLKVIASMFSLEAANELIDECLIQKKNLDFNVSGTGVIDHVLFKLAEVKVKCKRC